MFGAIGTAGRRCSTTRRIIVRQSIAPRLAERLVQAYTQVPIGDPLDAGTLMGPLVNGLAVEEMFDAIARAQAHGGQVLCGGKLRADLGPQFVEPLSVEQPA